MRDDAIWQVYYELAIKQLVINSLRLWKPQVLRPEMFSLACDKALVLLLFYARRGVVCRQASFGAVRLMQCAHSSPIT